MRELFWITIMACLLFACVTDCKTCQVYNVTWWISGGAAVLLLVGRESRLTIGVISELFVFIVLQLIFFSKMYGRADCYAFSVCAIAEASEGMGLGEYLLHMLWAFLLLAFVQGICHNIDKTGNLRKPVPFLPYITLAFCALLWYYYTC